MIDFNLSIGKINVSVTGYVLGLVIIICLNKNTFTHIFSTSIYEKHLFEYLSFIPLLWSHPNVTD